MARYWLQAAAAWIVGDLCENRVPQWTDQHSVFMYSSFMVSRQSANMASDNQGASKSLSSSVARCVFLLRRVKHVAPASNRKTGTRRVHEAIATYHELSTQHVQECEQ